MYFTLNPLLNLQIFELPPLEVEPVCSTLFLPLSIFFLVYHSKLAKYKRDQWWISFHLKQWWIINHLVLMFFDLMGRGKAVVLWLAPTTETIRQFALLDRYSGERQEIFYYRRHCTINFYSSLLLGVILGFGVKKASNFAVWWAVRLWFTLQLFTRVWVFPGDTLPGLHCSHRLSVFSFFLQ